MRVEDSRGEEVSGQQGASGIEYTGSEGLRVIKSLYLEDLFVDKEWRGTGIGSALIGAAADHTISHSLDRLEWVVLDFNKPSIKFYESLGAKPMDCQLLRISLSG
mmetsp:Transcript_19069/g.29783  ORF Transcript_19069/g.29783 Transcript_19069/m.29783 type:complete len:105 (-) Transcript_19069:141-455(-)